MQTVVQTRARPVKNRGILPIRRRTLRRADALAGLSLIAPSAAVFAAFVFLPVLLVAYVSFTDWDLLSNRMNFVGLQNYTGLLGSPEFLQALRNTLYFAGVQIPLDMGISLGFALLLNRKLRGVSVYRAAFFTPVVTSTVAMAAVWLWIYEPEMGLANYVLKFLRLSPVGWLDDPSWAMPAVILMSIWKGLGYDIVIFLAGLQNIPDMYLEAAAIDGASVWHRFWRVTFPLLSPVTYFVLVMSVINSFKVFTQIHVMTPTGGPLKSTAVLVFYIYSEAFERYHFGAAAAASVMLFALVVAATLLQRKIAEKRVHYQ